MKQFVEFLLKKILKTGLLELKLFYGAELTWFETD